MGRQEEETKDKDGMSYYADRSLTVDKSCLSSWYSITLQVKFPF